MRFFETIIALIVLTDLIAHLPYADLLYGRFGIYPEESLLDNIYLGSGLVQFLNTIFSHSWAPQVILASMIALCCGYLFAERRLFWNIFFYAGMTIVQTRNYYFLDGSDGVVSVTMPFIILYYVKEVADWSFFRGNQVWRQRLRTISGYAAFGLMIQVCVIYFFTGAHKVTKELWYNGTALYYAMRLDEFNATGLNIWLTRSAFFVMASTYFTLLWELTFPLLIWFRSTRYWVLGLGVMFHLGIYLLMRIEDFSWVMIGSYGVFVSDRALHRFRAFFRRPQFVLLYDSWCPVCTTFRARAERLDYFRLLQFASLREPDARLSGRNIDFTLAERRMACISLTDGSVVYGFASLVNVCRALPLCWPLLPLLQMAAATGTGDKLYDYLAVRRRILPVACTADCVINPQLSRS